MEENKMKNTKIINKRILLALQMLMDNGEGAVIAFKAGCDDIPDIVITVEDFFSLFHNQNAEIERLTEENEELQKQLADKKSEEGEIYEWAKKNIFFGK